MATLKEILADRAKYPDNGVIQIAGVAYNLGQLRETDSERQKAIIDKEAAIAAKEAALAKSLADVQTAQNQVASLYAAVETEKARIAAAAPNAAVANANSDPVKEAFARLENDNIIGPLVKYTKQLEAQLSGQLATYADSLKQVVDGVKKMGESYLTDRLMETYSSVVPADKQATLPIENLIKHALDNGYKTRAGYADLRRAYSELTAADRGLTEQRANIQTLLEVSGVSNPAEVAKTWQPGMDLKQFLAKSIQVAPPSGGAGAAGLTNFMPGANRKPSEFKTLDDAFAAAAKDAEIWGGRTDLSQLPIQ